MLPDSVISLLIQVPLVGCFIWFALRLSADYRADARDRDEKWQAFIAQQNELWRGFVDDIRVRSDNHSDVVSQRLFELGGIIRDLQRDFKDHDQRLLGYTEKRQ